MEADIRCILITVMVHLIQLFIYVFLVFLIHLVSILLLIILVDAIKLLVQWCCHVRICFKEVWILQVLPLLRLLLHHIKLLFSRWICLRGDWGKWLRSDEIFRHGYLSHCRSLIHVVDYRILYLFLCRAAWADRKLKHIWLYFHLTPEALLPRTVSYPEPERLVKIYILIRRRALTDLSSHMLLGLVLLC